MPVYRPDPGGVFESDVHRRVLASLPAPEAVPVAFEYAVRPILEDQNIPFYVADNETLPLLKEILDSLVGKDFATYDPEDRLVQRTKSGTAELAAPAPHELRDITAEQTTDREVANEYKAAVDARRQSRDRVKANQAARDEIEAAIADDEAVLASPEPERPDVSDPKAVEVLNAVEAVQANE